MPRLSEVLEWLKAGHQGFRQHLEEINDSELSAIRRTSDGSPVELRSLVTGAIQHDLYHAGEINHIRGLLVQDDHWAHER